MIKTFINLFILSGLVGLTKLNIEPEKYTKWEPTPETFNYKKISNWMEDKLISSREYTYTSLGQVKTVSYFDEEGEKRYLNKYYEYEYDLKGKITKSNVKFYNESGKTTVEVENNYKYDEYGDLIEEKEEDIIDQEREIKIWRTHEYEREEGLVIGEKEVDELTKERILSKEYERDKLGRITQELEDIGSGSVVRQKEYTYKDNFLDYESLLVQVQDSETQVFVNDSSEKREFDKEGKIIKNSNFDFIDGSETLRINEVYQYDDLNRVIKYELDDYRDSEKDEHKKCEYVYYKDTNYHLNSEFKFYDHETLTRTETNEYSYDHGRVVRFVNSVQLPGEEKKENTRSEYEYEGEIIHHYGEPTYLWDNNYTKCIASATCLECGETITEISIATKVDNKMIAKFNNPIFVTQEYIIPGPQPEPDKPGLSTGAIVGISVGGVAGVLLISALVYFLKIKKK